MRGMYKIAVLVLAAGLVLAIYATKAHSPETTVQHVPVMSLTLYFSNQDATALRPEKRDVPITNNMAAAAMEELLAGSRNPDLVTVIPAGTKLNSLSIRQDVAYVDLSSDILNTPNRGSASESLIVASIVNTLTEFPEIKKVQILIDGKKKETLYGHMDLSQPLTRFRESAASGMIVQAFKVRPRISSM